MLTALGERDTAVRDTERRAGEALQTMAIDEGLSLWVTPWVNPRTARDSFG